MRPKTENELVALSAALGAERVPTLSAAESAILGTASDVSGELVDATRQRIQDGEDPLGEFFAHLRSPKDRRPLGATYTPIAIASEMVRWARDHSDAVRIVDPGAGSARFLLLAAQRFPRAELIGVDVDPVATLLARASLAASGLEGRSTILQRDYRALRLPELDGPTLFIGNPPYVRHHEIEPRWKDWLSSTAGIYGLKASRLAGMHVYFYLATAGLARPGDFGTFITSAEWLDVNYGRLVRELFLDRLGGQGLVIVDPAARPFPDAASTAVIATFQAGANPVAIHVRRAQSAREIAPVGSGVAVRRERFVDENRWSHILRAPREIPDGYVELGEICRVHRGQVTGANDIWIAEAHSRELPDAVLFPSVTRARELIEAGDSLHDKSGLRRVIDIPADLDALDKSDRTVVERFLRWARQRGAHEGYVARHRSAWWSVGLRQPPPIFSTYMARRPPTFVRNVAGARYINIAHGIYPRERMSQHALDNLRSYLDRGALEARGRVYAGGLRKFEPRELERIPVPCPEILEGRA